MFLEGADVTSYAWDPVGVNYIKGDKGGAGTRRHSAPTISKVHINRAVSKVGAAPRAHRPELAALFGSEDF